MIEVRVNGPTVMYMVEPWGLKDKSKCYHQYYATDGEKFICCIGCGKIAALDATGAHKINAHLLSDDDVVTFLRRFPASLIAGIPRFSERPVTQT